MPAAAARGTLTVIHTGWIAPIAAATSLPNDARGTLYDPKRSGVARTAGGSDSSESIIGPVALFRNLSTSR